MLVLPENTLDLLWPTVVGVREERWQRQIVVQRVSPPHENAAGCYYDQAVRQQNLPNLLRIAEDPVHGRDWKRQEQRDQVHY